MTTTRQSQHDIGTRLQALALLENNVPVMRIVEITGISKPSIYSFWKIAILRGYNPQESLKLLLEYIINVPQSGWPIKATEEVKEAVKTIVTKNSTTRQLSTQIIVNKLITSGVHISAKTVWNILNSLGYSLQKLTYKPGLTNQVKAVRLKWCLDHKD